MASSRFGLGYRNSSVTGAIRKLGNGANSGLTSGVLSTLGLSGFRRGSTASTSSPSAASMRGGLGGQTVSAARQAAERVIEEREKLYVELKVCRRFLCDCFDFVVCQINFFLTIIQLVFM